MYEITVSDANGCTASDSVFVSEPDDITFIANVTSTNIYNGFGVSCNGSSDGEITFSNIVGGTPNFEFSIDNGSSYSSDSVLNNTNGYLITANTYNLIVRDANNCLTNVVSVVVDQEATSKVKDEKPLGKFNGFGTYVDLSLIHI